MDSIIQKERKCFLCGKVTPLEMHHIFGGANRKKSERYGLKVYLCHWCHNEPPAGVHFNRENDLILKQTAQRVFERDHTREQFMEEFGRNYLD